MIKCMMLPHRCREWSVVVVNHNYDDPFPNEEGRCISVFQTEDIDAVYFKHKEDALMFSLANNVVY